MVLAIIYIFNYLKQILLSSNICLFGILMQKEHLTMEKYFELNYTLFHFYYKYIYYLKNNLANINRELKYLILRFYD